MKDGERAEGEEAPSEVKKALQRYDADVKGLTDQMIAKAVRILATEHARFMKNWMTEIEKAMKSISGR